MVKAVVFDVDDTLYPELDYIRSGFSLLCSYLNSIGIEAKTDDMVACFTTNASDAIKEYLCSINHYSTDLHESLLSIHRAHIPQLKPFENLENILIKLKNKGLILGIISDGTPYAQNNKVIGLGLDKYFDYKVYSDALGGKHCRKPCDVSFRAIANQMNLRFDEMIYIGDNCDRDFYPCEHLGILGMQIAIPGGVYFGKKYKNTYENYFQLEKALIKILEAQ